MKHFDRAGLSRRSALNLGAAAAGSFALPSVAAPKPDAVRLAADTRGQLFDADWRFLRGDAPSFSEPGFNDSAWRRLDVPHDWSIEDREPGSKAVNGVVRLVDTAPLWQSANDAPKAIGPFFGGGTLVGEGDLSSGGRDTGYTVGGVGWYRKRFRLPALPADARIEVAFDGVYMNAEVWLNGKLVGRRPYGYAPFAFDLTPYVDLAGENVLAVRVGNLGHNSRWYSGSGIYRHVRLNITGAHRFATWGLAVATASVSPAAATVHVRARVEAFEPGSVIVARLRDEAGKVVAEAQTPAARESLVELSLRRPRLWSPETPALYQAECELVSGMQVQDRLATTFGVRSVEIDAAHGLRINGRPYKLRGGCIHHDNGLLGAAAIDRAEERKVELLKARGYNALRTSHNPPSPALLDACDRLGMLVMEEAFDCWRVGKNPEDYSLYFEGWWREDLAAMIARDGNHPSVIMWSIGNEIPEAGKPLGVETEQMLAEAVRQLDPTRPVTQGINIANGPEVRRPDGRPDEAATQFLDIAGYNYRLERAPKEHEKYPDRVFVGTESFPGSVVDIWRLADQNTYVIGDFVWSAMDYLGEAGCGRPYLLGDKVSVAATYPWFNAFCGDLDLIGEQKPQSLLRDVVWGLSGLEMAVQRPLPEGRQERVTPWGWRDELQSWTWPGQEGKPLAVSLYTTGDRVQITLDGRVVGEKTLSEADKCLAAVPVPYAPGKLVATAFRGGKRIGRRSLETVGAPAALRLRTDRLRLRSARDDLAFVTVEIVDAQGRLTPDTVKVVETALSGAAELAAFGNANPRGVGSFRQPVAKTWHGRALAIVRPLGTSGSVVVEARTEGLQSARLELQLVS